MKTKLFLTFLLSFYFYLLSSQIPQGFNYQAVARDAGGNPITNASMPVRITIQSDSLGTGIIWQELHSSVITNSFGLFTLVLGKGARQSASTVATFNDLNWSVTPKFIKTEIYYSSIWNTMGVSRLWSVPFALRARESDQWITSGLNIYRDYGYKVGIGNAFPANFLDVQGGINAGGIINYNSVNRLGLGVIGDGTPNGLPKNDEGAYVGWMHSGLGHSAGTLALISRSFPQNCDISFYTGNVDPIERMTIKYNGNVGIGTVNPSSIFTVQPPVVWDDNSPLFEIKNKNGQTVFAVYNEGVRVYVSDGAKGVKGGFAVGGFGTDKAESQKYLVVSKDSVRIYLDTNPATKKLKGGFAVGGYDLTKGEVQDYLDVNSDSVRIYIDANPATKKLKGGFAVGGYDLTKGIKRDYLNVNTDARGIINPSQNRILWYPLKNAFLTGKVLISDSANVGVNSFASGYESKAKGNWSQALGFKAIANGNYSTAIGKNAVANNNSSFAFGEGAITNNSESYAIGREAVANGYRSFAFGSAGIDSLGDPTGVAKALGDYSFAIGAGSIAIGNGSFSIGIADTAQGDFSMAFGYQTAARGWFATALGVLTKSTNFASTSFGDRTTASGHTSFATGSYSIASGPVSATFGILNKATGIGTVAMGGLTTAKSYGSLVIGTNNIVSGDSLHWVWTDPLFVIGNGWGMAPRNAMTVLKNGYVGIGTAIPQSALDVRGPITGDNNYTEPGNAGTSDVAGDKLVLYESGTWRTSIGMSSVGPYLQGTGGTAADNGIRFITGSSSATERMRITRDGNVGIGTTSPGYKLTINGTTWCSSGAWTGSDIRWKKNISALNNTLSGVLKLQAVNYNLRIDEFPELGFESRDQVGFIAQDVEKVFPLLVNTDNNGYKAVAYDKLSAVLVEAIKEQQQQIDSQQQENKQLRSEVQSIREEMEQLKIMLAKGDTK
ncbi:MAG: tail fiber domain-containing protein [Bacteroidia bacterium]|nr:tail fiber domain-containing protein [Bacteroidia bacterium]